MVAQLGKVAAKQAVACLKMVEVFEGELGAVWKEGLV